MCHLYSWRLVCHFKLIKTANGAVKALSAAQSLWGKSSQAEVQLQKQRAEKSEVWVPLACVILSTRGSDPQFTQSWSGESGCCFHRNESTHGCVSPQGKPLRASHGLGVPAPNTEGSGRTAAPTESRVINRPAVVWLFATLPAELR